MLQFTPKGVALHSPGSRQRTLGEKRGPQQAAYPEGVIQTGISIMAQSLAQIYLHVVFSTRNRAPFLQDRALRDRTHAYLAGTCRNLHSPSLIVGGVADHVHLL